MLLRARWILLSLDTRLSLVRPSGPTLYSHRVKWSRGPFPLYKLHVVSSKAVEKSKITGVSFVAYCYQLQQICSISVVEYLFLCHFATCSTTLTSCCEYCGTVDLWLSVVSLRGLLKMRQSVPFLFGRTRFPAACCSGGRSLFRRSSTN